MFAEGEDEEMSITIHAEPDVTMTIKPLNSDWLTATSYINRIPQVIAAPPGLVTSDKLPRLAYVHSLKADDSNTKLI